MTEEEAFYKTQEAILSLSQYNLPTKTNPILPVKQAGILRFKDNEPPPQYRLNIKFNFDQKFENECQNYSPEQQENDQKNFLTYKQKIALLKNEKAKLKNLNDQHQWKLKTDLDQVRLGIETQIQQKIETLQKRYNKNLAEIKRAFTNEVEVPLFKTIKEDNHQSQIVMQQKNEGEMNFQNKNTSPYLIITDYQEDVKRDKSCKTPSIFGKTGYNGSTQQNNQDINLVSKIGGIQYINGGIQMQRIDYIKKRLLNGINDPDTQSQNRSSFTGNRTSLPGVRNKFTFDITNNNFYYREDGQESIQANNKKNQAKMLESIIPDIQSPSKFESSIKKQKLDSIKRNKYNKNTNRQFFNNTITDFVKLKNNQMSKINEKRITEENSLEMKKKSEYHDETSQTVSAGALQEMAGSQKSLIQKKQLFKLKQKLKQSNVDVDINNQQSYYKTDETGKRQKSCQITETTEEIYQTSFQDQIERQNKQFILTQDFKNIDSDRQNSNIKVQQQKLDQQQVDFSSFKKFDPIDYQNQIAQKILKKSLAQTSRSNKFYKN